MGRLLASLLCFLLVASVEHAAGAPTPEQYWKSALPDTPMPSSLSQLLNTSSASVSEHRKPPGTAVGIWAFHYFDHYDATETHLQHMSDDPSAALFFLEKDLEKQHTGRKKLTKGLHFMATSGAGERFLPRSEADAIPFSSGEVPEILTRFSVKPESAKAAEMARTLHVCEAPAAEGEKKWCATSLESMVDFATSSHGTSRVRAVSTVVGKEGTPRQGYTLTGVKRAGDDQLVVCHAEPYAYAVFACHLTQATRAYTMSMVGEDGTAVEAVAVCHADTAGWNPRHVAFQVLNVKPGTVPVCHLVPQDHVVWTRSLTFASYLDV